jgi:hypothetical protein
MDGGKWLMLDARYWMIDKTESYSLNTQHPVPLIISKGEIQYGSY